MRNKYSISEFVGTTYSLILTKVFMRQSRLIRRPVYLRGIRSVDGASGLTTGRFCRFDLDGERKTLYIGNNCEMGDMTHIVALNNVKIGDDVLIASKCFISDTNHGEYSGIEQDSPLEKPNHRKLKSGSAKIGDRVWIGENAVILSGADIGDGCIVGANSVVTKKIPPQSMVIGNNKIIKKWNESTHKWERI